MSARIVTDPCDRSCGRSMPGAAAKAACTAKGSYRCVDTGSPVNLNSVPDITTENRWRRTDCPKQDKPVTAAAAPAPYTGPIVRCDLGEARRQQLAIRGRWSDGVSGLARTYCGESAAVSGDRLLQVLLYLTILLFVSAGVLATGAQPISFGEMVEVGRDRDFFGGGHLRAYPDITLGAKSELLALSIRRYGCRRGKVGMRSTGRRECSED